VSADLEDGFGPAPETCAETIHLACSIGLVGGSIEDATGDPANPIYDLSQAVERVRAAAEAARNLPFLLTARAENFLWDTPDLDDTIKRLQAFSAAGAHVLYAPGLPDIETIRTVCAAVDRPVNVVMGLKGQNYSVAELSDAGVRRVSVGGSFARAALGALMRAAKEVSPTPRMRCPTAKSPGSCRKKSAVRGNDRRIREPEVVPGDATRTVTVPVHSSHDLKPGALRSIIKQAGFSL
jgi:2-methylisocitrate lyase-like PEP mutase family enzyme